MKTYKEFIKEAGDWWHPDPKKDRAISGVGNKMRARQDTDQDTSVRKKSDYSNRLKPGETYMQFSKRKQAAASQKSVQQKSKESLKDKIKRKLGSAIDRVAGL